MKQGLSNYIGLGIASGVAIGATLFSIKGEPFWIGIGISLGIAVGIGVSEAQKRQR